MDENQSQSLLDLELNQEARTNILDATRWGKFMAVLILTACALFCLIFIIFWGKIAELFLALESSDVSGANASGAIMSVFVGVIIVMFAILAILMSFLIRGANNVRKGLENGDQGLFNIGLNHLKNYFAMYGVLGILGLLFTIIGLLNK